MELQSLPADIGPQEIVYLADKLVEEDRLVTLEERLRDKLARFAANPDGCRAIKRRLHAALAIQQRIELRLGKPLDLLFREDLGSSTPVAGQNSISHSRKLQAGE